MRRKVGTWTLRWAKGPGRHSLLWAVNALLIAALPLLAWVQPSCRADLLACGGSWDAGWMIPRLLAFPAFLTACMLFGSARAQRKHARIDQDYFSRLEAAEQPDLPPGHFEATPLDQDLTKRTLRGLAAGALVAGLAMVPLLLTRIALRACDPWPSASASGLPVCSTTQQWTDALVAFESWLFIASSLLLALILFTRSTAIVVQGLPKRRRRFLGRIARA